MTDHAFLAVNPTAEERHQLAAALTEASPGHPLPGRRTPPENWHITLRFLGECSLDEADRVMFRLSETADDGEGRVWCDGLDAFPRQAKAGVLFSSIDDPAGTLTRLASWCDEAAADAGFSPEGRPYVPHLTLSRMQPAVDVRQTFGPWDDFRVGIDVRAISMMRTRRTRSGIRYEVVDSLDLCQAT